MLRNLFLFVSLLFSFLAQAQYIGSGVYYNRSVEEWQEDTLYVVVHPEYPQYNEVIKAYMDSNWTINDLAYIDREVIDNKEFRENHPEMVVLDLVALYNDIMSLPYSGNGTGYPEGLEDSWLALAIFEVNMLYAPMFKDEPAILLSPKRALVYYSFVRSIKDPRLKDTDSEEVFTTDFNVNPLHYQALIAIKQLNFLAKESVVAKSGIADATFILDMRKRMNQSGRIRRKILLIDSMHINQELKEEDIAKYFNKTKYRIASSEEIHQLVKEGHEDYCLLIGHSSGAGYHISVFDLATEEIVYFDTDRAKYLEPKHIKDVRKNF
ncbi:hypothetical protein [Croceimicrobium hydrocarbonivorans]|uniref:Uncharacterized protein n=1 Tax=Croceimicrobium hydrocarbonivorans TaxID=2761580 RepID=A0A7H0VIQ4_9FLAO|nr:hypothetical protein [Croceimicrobium hydrocarbonivorans]QNR25602.1 hypothetical protein H4K34_07100 [Croceimicrobium hydrocarbonivorans]